VTNKLLTVQETARLLNISIFSVYRMANKGQIPSLKIGNMRRFKRTDLDTWLKKCSTTTEG
jgi:nitrogen PTS system EIIA component